ncbi:hypothetical protein ACMGDM_08015 [Sphingomonas sp. DT-51]|uniref:hypothetical protein n=1 Tax=Sphingomonas sp. DT-51 TaxID=3396165 RepID=UPI003F1938DB
MSGWRVPVALALAVGLAGCGSTEALKPAPGTPLPVAPYGATATPAINDLLTPSVQTRPRRTGEVLTRSQPRQSDEFDLPPK